MRKALDGAIFTNNELVKIPLDGFLAFMIRNLAQLCIEWMTIVAIDLDLGHHREGHTELRFAECCNLFMRAWLLGSELIAWESNNNQSLGLLCFIASGLLLLRLRLTHSFLSV